MRVQLVTILPILLFSFTVAIGQNEDKKNLPPTEIDFLFSYYKQDGDSSAVTGGQGTEELKDIAGVIIVNFPVKYNKDFIFKSGISHYTSASSDQIDPNTISSASYHNFSFLAEGTSIKRDTARNTSRSISFRGNLQLNFISLGAGYSLTKFSKDNSRSFTLKGIFNYDVWAPYYKLNKLYPKEIRFFTEPLSTNRRYTTDLSFSLNQVINQKLQVGFTLGTIYQWGLLSTPFHRVYFKEQEMPDLERLPDRRIRIPIVGRLNYFMNDFLILRTFYRMYFDDFGIQAHTISLETPVKLSNFFSIYPYYRYYYQNSSRYFAPYKKHSFESEYHTSDYDLSTFHSNMLGGGFRISPPLGINKKGIVEGKSRLLFRTIEFRYGQYRRSNGLRAHIFSLNLGYLL